MDPNEEGLMLLFPNLEFHSTLLVPMVPMPRSMLSMRNIPRIKLTPLPMHRLLLRASTAMETLLSLRDIPETGRPALKMLARLKQGPDKRHHNWMDFILE